MPDDVFLIDVSHGDASDGEPGKRRVRRVIDTVASTAGIVAAGAANRRPFDRYGLVQDQWKSLGHQGGAW